jgi:hypothetical protein
MEQGTNTKIKASFAGQVSIFKSPHDSSVTLVDVARTNKYGQLEWCAIQHDDPIYGMAIAATKSDNGELVFNQMQGTANHDSGYLTLEQFAATRQLILKDMVSDMEWCKVNDCHQQLIAEYAGKCFIGIFESGHQLVIGRSEYQNDNLAELERILYDEWFIPEVVGYEKTNLARGIYTIEIEVPYDSTLHGKLQAAYDDGAAGFFRLENVANKTFIVFERSVADDAEYLEERIVNGADLLQAARWQLADEFEERHEDTLGQIIETLRSPDAKVSCLTSEALSAQSSDNLSIPDAPAQLPEVGCVLGAPYPDWPEHLTTFAERKVYQLGVAHGKAVQKHQDAEHIEQLKAKLLDIDRGLNIGEQALSVAAQGKHEDAPFPLDEHEAKLWHHAQAAAYQHVLEMCGSTSIKAFIEHGFKPPSKQQDASMGM